MSHLHAGREGVDDAMDMHRIGVVSFCSGLLCHLVTRCQANQKVVQKQEKFIDLMREVLPAIPALDVQLEMLEVLFRVYRNSRCMSFGDLGSTCLASVKGKLDSLVVAKGQKLNLTRRLVDIVVAFNASQSKVPSLCRSELHVGPVTVLPVTKAYLKSMDATTAISKHFDSIALSPSSIALMMEYELGDGLQDDWLVIPTSALKDSSTSAVHGSKVKQVCLQLALCKRSSAHGLRRYLEFAGGPFSDYPSSFQSQHRSPRAPGSNDTKMLRHHPVPRDDACLCAKAPGIY